MRTLIASLAVALMMAGSAYAEDGAVSKDTLASFGLGGMQQMTDAQGTQVRGKWALAWGNSYSVSNSISFTTNSTAATDNHYSAGGNTWAGGFNLSGSTAQTGGFFTSSALAGGFSFGAGN